MHGAILVDSRRKQDIPDPWTFPDAAHYRGVTPINTKNFLDSRAHGVSPVPGTLQGTGDPCLREIVDELVHGEIESFRDEAFPGNSDSVVSSSSVLQGTVISVIVVAFGNEAAGCSDAVTLRKCGYFPHTLRQDQSCKALD